MSPSNPSISTRPTAAASECDVARAFTDALQHGLFGKFLGRTWVSFGVQVNTLQQQASESGAPSDDILVGRAKAGDGTAFEQLLARHYRFIFKVAYRWLGHQSDAEDVTQTICMRLADTIRSFDGRAAFTSWLYRVTLNAVRDHQRSQQRRGKLADAVKHTTEEGRDGDQEDALHIADIWRAVRSLPDKQRDAILLVHGEELSQAEAARIMGCQEVTIAWHIHKARKALRTLL